MKYFFLAISLLFGTLLAPGTTTAQSLETLGGGSENISIRLIPPRPAPQQNVTVIIESFAMNLDRATISWFLDNKIQSESVGRKTFSFKTGKSGSVSNILIVIRTSEGAVIQQSLIIHPASVDIVSEALSYTPPFYKGKALYPFQGTVKVVALPNIVTPNGTTLDPKKLLYSWKVDGHLAGAASGYGKTFIYFTGTIPLKPAVVSVEVASLDQEYVAEGKTTLSPVQPQIIFYEENPLMGTLYNKALSANIPLRDEEIKIVAIPYFSGVTEREGGDVKYEWRMNTELVPGSNGKSSLIFRQQKGVEGVAAISLQTSNTAKIFQFSNANLSLRFGATEPTSQF